MAKGKQLKRRKAPEEPQQQNNETEGLADQVRQQANEELQSIDPEISCERTISTGSTLLDLAISGGRTRYGGIPPGIIVEICGLPSTGKTAILAETCGNALAKGGDIHFADPETRLDKEYSRIYGVEIPEDHYSRPTTVEEIFNHIGNWSPENESVINIYGADSLAALSTEMEVDDKDKRGQNRAKKFSEGVRKTMHKIAKPHKLLICTNQIREGDYGKFTPGGWAIPFYASLRIELSKSKPHQLKKTTKYTEKGSQQEKVVGIKSDARCTKNTINDPFREAPIYIMFGYGIDDIRANLQYLKELKGEETYGEIANNYATIDRAVRYIEDNDLEMTLKEQVIDAWNEVENKLKVKRKPKKRR